MSNLVKVQIKYGAMAGVLNAALLIILYFLGRHPFLISPLLDFRILLFTIFIFFGLKEFRDYDQNGILYLWQAMLGALLLVLVTSVIAAVILQLFGSLNEAFVPSYIKLMTEYLKTFPKADIDKIGKEVFERNLAVLPSTTMSSLTITYFAQGIGIGFFISIILSVILRRQQKP